MEYLLVTLLTGPLILLVFSFFVKKLFRRPTVSDFDKKYVLITGCDSGFGKETAIRLDQLGFHVFATCLTQAGENNLKSVCSDKLKVFQLDVTRHEQIKQVFEQIKCFLPRNTGLWGIVNNAGILIPGLIEWQPLENFKLHADVNLWGLIDVTKTFLPLVKLAKGRIVNMSSAMGRVAFKHLSAYCITKYGVEAFSDALRREMAPWGIKVCIIEPGGFKTPMMAPGNIVSKYRQVWEHLDSCVKDDYGQEFIDELFESFEAAIDMTSSDITQVCDAIIDSLSVQSPKTRYKVGLDSKLFNIFALLPTVLEDLLVRPFCLPSIPKSKKNGPYFLR